MTWRSTLDKADPIGLDEVNAQAGLMARVDSKYFVPVEVMQELSSELFAGHRVTQINGEREFLYESMYFDTPDLRCFRDHAQRRRHRAKVRTRTYVDSMLTFIEVKLSGARGTTAKTRTEYGYDDRFALTPGGRRFAADVLSRGGVPLDTDVLKPSMLTTYRRSTLVDAVRGVRITVDADLAWRTPSGAELRARSDMLLLEVKSARGRAPANRLLHGHGIRPVRMSKYPAGIGALHPDLPANSWHRALRTYAANAPRFLTSYSA
ncbi:polyphosphate polymerase domain-containing protein [Spelaeicoccus albus]|uniref:VTC domain-containing protein n=1 Tax=Spelaeicoccus albus TaxID=1280376 RepID=A0A7Z0D4D2_9MICO|nr:polyphosphate polymerase domain-containing protein [Spelaeicoccus albus]NYI68672.1 hypothetical protein [Spelaeicoccus albus]